MQDCEHDHALGLDTVENSIREPRNKGSTYFAVDAGKHFRITLNGVED